MIFLYIVFLHKYIMYILLDDDNSNLGVNYIWATAIKKVIYEPLFHLRMATDS